MAAPKKATEKAAAPRRRTVKGAAPMTYESTLQPNMRAQLAAAARGENGAVEVDAIIENTGKEG